MGGAVVSRLVILVGGTLYPAYASYKAVKSANVRQYVRWMMYWVVFALFTTVETFTDLLLSWVPFYYEIKVGFVVWLLSPYTKGAAFLYRRFIHPMLAKREPEIDRFLLSARQRSYATMLDVGSRGINVAANAVVTAAVKGQAVMSDRLKSFSVNDLSRLSDDTPIHSMDPSAYNPPLEREVLRRTADTPRFEMGTAPLQRTNVQYQETSNHGYGSAQTSADMILPPSGSMMPSSLSMYPGPRMSPYSGDDQLGSQYKAYSMMNLSGAGEHGHTMTRRIEFTTAPPVASVDDSVIPDRMEATSDEPSYGTIPRQRKKKHKKDKDPSVRRSKRRTKTSSYHEGSEDEREQE